jgi:pSer/pThr/pTyr-binding forkhead associated (FHA) protein
VSYVFCNRCGHRNPPDSAFCSACGSTLDLPADHTVTLAKVHPLLDAPGPDDDIVVELVTRPGVGELVVRSGAQAGDRFTLVTEVTRLGRHPDSEISLDDITVSRRHAEIHRLADGRYEVRDAGSLNGTYVNQTRIDRAPLDHGDEVQVGKFRLLFFDRPRQDA